MINLSGNSKKAQVLREAESETERTGRSLLKFISLIYIPNPGLMLLSSFAS